MLVNYRLGFPGVPVGGSLGWTGRIMTAATRGLQDGVRRARFLGAADAGRRRRPGSGVRLQRARGAWAEPDEAHFVPGVGAVMTSYLSSLVARSQSARNGVLGVPGLAMVRPRPHSLFESAAPGPAWIGEQDGQHEVAGAGSPASPSPPARTRAPVSHRYAVSGPDRADAPEATVLGTWEAAAPDPPEVHGVPRPGPAVGAAPAVDLAAVEPVEPAHGSRRGAAHVDPAGPAGPELQGPIAENPSNTVGRPNIAAPQGPATEQRSTVLPPGQDPGRRGRTSDRVPAQPDPWQRYGTDPRSAGRAAGSMGQSPRAGGVPEDAVEPGALDPVGQVRAADAFGVLNSAHLRLPRVPARSVPPVGTTRRAAAEPQALETVVQISIGRVELRAVAPGPAEATRAAAASTPLSIDRYLQGRR